MAGQVTEAVERCCIGRPAACLNSDGHKKRVWADHGS